jgi:hypothetical protein
MKLPFPIEQFLGVFKKYNIAVFPAQLLLVLLAACVIYFAARTNKWSGKAISFILAGLWLWVGAVYHIGFFSVINKAAYGFGALFILEGIILFIYAFKAPLFSFQKNVASVVSTVFLVYALFIYLLLGYTAGHGYPYSPTFGLPCPTTIFTLAVFLLAVNRLPFHLIAIPLLWTAIGFSAAFKLGIYEDAMLIVSGLALAVLNLRKPKTWHLQNAALGKL